MRKRGNTDAGAVATRIALSRITLVVLWVAILMAAMVGLWSYKLTPGAPGEARALWPSASRLTPAPDRPTLVMFAHPRCPCTRASLAELRILLSRFAGRVTTYIVFMRPAGSSADWSRTDTWASAASLSGVQLIEDTEGHEAGLFGAETSGHVVLYDAHRRLLFGGGITPGRGHVGDSPQFDQLSRLLEQASATSGATPTPPHPGAVYGCPLREDRR